MKALVIYESMFGNTRAIAQSIAVGLVRYGDVDIYEVSKAPAQLPEDVSLLVLGGPTHAFTMSREQTRASASQQTDAVVSRGIGIREWIAGLEGRARRIPVATFDTRINHPRWFWGSAARAARRALRRHGFFNVIRAENFFVRGPGGEVTDALLDGEIERALAWGQDLGAMAARRAPRAIPASRGATAAESR